MSDGITPLSPEQFKYQEEEALKEGYLKRVLVALDQDINVDTGGLPDETVSSRLERDAVKHEWIGEIGSKALDLLQNDHGAKAEAGDAARGLQVAAIDSAADGQK